MDDIPLLSPFSMQDLEELRARCIRDAKRRRGEYVPLFDQPIDEPALSWPQRLCRKLCGCQSSQKEKDPLPQIDTVIMSVEDINGYYRLALAQLRGEAPWPNRPLKCAVKTPRT